MGSRWTGEYIIKELIAKYGSLEAAIRSLQYQVDNDHAYQAMNAVIEERRTWQIGYIEKIEQRFYENTVELALNIVMPHGRIFSYPLSPVEYIQTLHELGTFNVTALIGKMCFVADTDGLPQFRGLWIPNQNEKRVKLTTISEYSD